MQLQAILLRQLRKHRRKWLDVIRAIVRRERNSGKHHLYLRLLETGDHLFQMLST